MTACLSYLLLFDLSSTFFTFFFFLFFCLQNSVFCFVNSSGRYDETKKRLTPQRRRRELNPCAAINDLIPFQGIPFSLLGTSAENNILIFLWINGKDGIRTHVPLRTNGFQDRLVMTTSIPFHIAPHLLYRSKVLDYFNKKALSCQ